MIKILVVDDESSIRTALAYALRREGYKVEMAVDGQEALDKVEAFRPAVMVLDVMMPRVSGYEVCRKLDGQILLLTVKDDIVDKVLGLELGKVSLLGLSYYPIYPLSWSPSGTRLGITVDDKEKLVVTHIVDFKS